MRYLKEMNKGRNARSVNGKILEELDEVVYLGSYFVKMNFEKMEDTRWIGKDVLFRVTGLMLRYLSLAKRNATICTQNSKNVK